MFSCFFICTRLAQAMSGGNYSGYSYEDLPSNSAGLDFYWAYRNKIKNGTMTLTDAINEYFQKVYITEPKNAPNYKMIPHILDGNVATNITPIGLVGSALFNAAYEAFCKKSRATKIKILVAHKLIKPSSHE